MFFFSNHFLSSRFFFLNGLCSWFCIFNLLLFVLFIYLFLPLLIYSWLLKNNVQLGHSTSPSNLAAHMAGEIRNSTLRHTQTCHPCPLWSPTSNLLLTFTKIITYTICNIYIYIYRYFVNTFPLAFFRYLFSLKIQNLLISYIIVFSFTFHWP